MPVLFVSTFRANRAAPGQPTASVIDDLLALGWLPADPSTNASLTTSVLLMTANESVALSVLDQRAVDSDANRRRPRISRRWGRVVSLLPDEFPRLRDF